MLKLSSIVKVHDLIYVHQTNTCMKHKELSEAIEWKVTNIFLLSRFYITHRKYLYLKCIL